MPTSAPTTTLTAASFAGSGRSLIREFPLPEPQPGQLRVRLEGCGLCGSNLPAWEGRAWFGYPLEPGAPGHEGWGVVEALGDGVADPEPGRRVACLSSHAFATHDLVAADAVALLPDELDGLPFPAEPLACAMNVFERAGIERGQDVAIVGIGFLGALLTDLAARAGARVLAISRRPFALGIARRLGSQETIVLDEHARVIERVRTLTGGRFCERVIECVGTQWPLDLAGELTAERGRLVVAGFHQDGPRQVNMQRWNWRGLDVINAHERDPARYVAGMKAAIAATVAGRLDPFGLLTHSLPLGRIDDGFRLMQTRPEGFLKAWVKP